MEIFALVPTKKLHFFNNSNIHLLFGTLIAIFSFRFNDFFKSSLITFKIIVNFHGQNFSAILLVNLSNDTIFSATSFEYTKTGSGFEIFLDLIS